MAIYSSISNAPIKYLVLLSGLVLLFISCGLASAAPIKVGVYENKPLVYRDAQGEYHGFSIDVLRYIAEQENWQLQFIPGTWTECLQRLETGEIDLQVSIAVTDARKKLFGYPERTLITNWGRLYRHPGSQVESLLDLDGKKVALLEKDIHAKVFFELMDKFGKRVEPVYLKTYDEVLEQVEQGSVTVGVVNRMYAMQNAHRYGVETTPMLFNPIEVRYATPKGKNAHLLAALDRHIQELRQDKNSIYFTSLEKWFGNSQVTIIPIWAKTVLLIATTLLLLIFAISMLLKRQVNRKTSELKNLNLQLTDQVSQLQTAKSSLHESEAKYRTLLETAAEGFWLVDSELKTVEVNKSLCQMLRYSPAELIGKTPFDLTDTANQQIFRKETATIDNTAHRCYEVTLKCKDGSDLPVIVNATTLRSNSGERQGSFAFITDITERKLSDRKQQLSNERFITVLNSIDAGIYVADMETFEILFMNQFLIDEFGQDLTGQTCWKAFRNEPYRCDYCTNELLIDESGQPKGMQVWQGENPLSGKHYMNHDRAIRWTDGRIVRLQISTDISEIKTLEAQLRQKYKMEAVGLMAGGIAHDFNNILTIIMTNLELMHRKMTEDNPLLTRLEQAKLASQRASDLVKQILTYSRQGKHNLKSVQLAFIIEESMKLLRSTTPASIEILTQIDLAAKNEKIEADSTQIEEVLINLCTNAIHAMGEKGLLTVALKKEVLQAGSLPDHPNTITGHYLKLTVSDTGSGMTRDVIDKVFDPFYTTKPAGQGTGMGLSISHGIVNKHNGYFTVSSAPGQGSSFSIYLPIIESVQPPAPEKICTDLPRGSERILLIDDEESLAHSVGDFLIEHGFSVQLETDSTRALRLLKSEAEDFDLVITDQTMPELTGLELASEVLKSKPQQAIILCTGYSAALTEDAALTAGIKAVLMKPLDLSALPQTIRTVLDAR